MAFLKGHFRVHAPADPNSRPSRVKARAAAARDKYEPITTESVPLNIRWKPGRGRPGAAVTMFSAFGAEYKLVRDLDTGNVQYFRLKGSDTVVKSPAEKSAEIDAEPEKPAQFRLHVGRQCWLVDVDGHWFLCLVVDRQAEPAKRITLRSVTGFDAERVVAWPYPELLTFTAQPSNRLWNRLRPLKARRP